MKDIATFLLAFVLLVPKSVFACVSFGPARHSLSDHLIQLSIPFIILTLLIYLLLRAVPKFKINSIDWAVTHAITFAIAIIFIGLLLLMLFRPMYFGVQKAYPAIEIPSSPTQTP